MLCSALWFSIAWLKGDYRNVDLVTYSFQFLLKAKQGYTDSEKTLSCPRQDLNPHATTESLGQWMYSTYPLATCPTPTYPIPSVGSGEWVARQGPKSASSVPCEHVQDLWKQKYLITVILYTETQWKECEQWAAWLCTIKIEISRLLDNSSSFDILHIMWTDITLQDSHWKKRYVCRTGQTKLVFIDYHTQRFTL